jgi:hypothetical protein
MGVTICSIALFVMCLFGNAYYIAYPTAWVASWRLLGCGWYGAFLGVFAWYANPALVMAWIFQFKGKGKLSLLAAIIALALIVAFFFGSMYLTKVESNRTAKRTKPALRGLLLFRLGLRLIRPALCWPLLLQRISESPSPRFVEFDA